MNQCFWTIQLSEWFSDIIIKKILIVPEWICVYEQIDWEKTATVILNIVVYCLYKSKSFSANLLKTNSLHSLYDLLKTTLLLQQKESDSNSNLKKYLPLRLRIKTETRWLSMLTIPLWSARIARRKKLVIFTMAKLTSPNSRWITRQGNTQTMAQTPSMLSFKWQRERNKSTVLRKWTHFILRCRKSDFSAC